MKAGHLASQQEDEFVKQIRNVLSSTSAKKFSSAESATSSTTVATPTTSTLKDGSKVAPVQEQAEVKVGVSLEATKPSQNPAEPPSSSANSGNGSTSAPVLPTETPAIVSGSGLMVSASAGVQQSPSQPSSQPPSPPSDSIKISFSETAPSTKAVSSSVGIVEHAQDSQSEPGISTLTISTVGGRQTYSQAVINGNGGSVIKAAGIVPISTAPVFTQTNVLAGATCSIAPGALPTCPVPVTVAVSDLASLSSSSVVESNQPVKKKKTFEVETVTETDSPSPDHSEISAHSSTENLSVEAEATSQTHSVATTDSEGYRNVVVNYPSSGNPLESRSDSYISTRQSQRGMVGANGSSVAGITEFGTTGESSNTPEPTPAPPASTNVVSLVCHPAPSGAPVVSCRLPPSQNSDALCGVPPPLPQVSMSQYPILPYYGVDAGMKNRSISVGNVPPDWHSGYYHYNTAPQQHYVSRQTIAGDTYVPPVQRTYHGSQQHLSPQVRSFPMEQSQLHHTNAHHHHHHIHAHPELPMKDLDKHQEATLASSVPVQHPQAKEAYRTQQQVPTPNRTISTDRPSPGHAYTIDDFPQAGLLSQAFMQFMYSMSTIFRDPKYEPLLNSLDQQFGAGTVPHSAPPTLPAEEEPRGETEREHSVTRCNTHPTLTSMRHSDRDDSELTNIMMQ